MQSQILKERESHLKYQQYELKEMKRRARLVEKLGFSDLIPEEIYSESSEEMDSKVISLLLEGKISPGQYCVYQDQRNGFHLLSFEEFVFG